MLTLQQCVAEDCRRHIYYPRPCCPFCDSEDPAWVQVSGEGKILSFARITRPQTPAFANDVPYYFVAIRLKEGPVMLSRLTDLPESDAGLSGRAVQVRFVQHTPTQKLPMFCLA